MFNILIIEDTKSYQKNIKKVISEMGYNVCGCFDNGEEAVHYIINNENIADLVIVDVILKSEMDGYEVARKIATKADIPIIFLTGKEDNLKNIDFDEIYVYTYLNKPFNNQELSNNIEMILHRYSSHQKVKKQLKVIKKQKERLASILEGTNVGTWEWNVQTGETIINERWAEIIGYTIEKLSPVSIETWMKHTHPDDLEKSNIVLEKLFTGEIDYYDKECRMKHKNGHWVWVQDRGKIVSWTEDGKPLWMFGTQQDITERKQMEENLQESEEKNRNLFETMTQGIIYQAKDGTIISANPAAERILGLSFHKMLGKASMDPYWNMINEDGSPVPENEYPTLMALETGKKVGPVIRGVFHPDKDTHIWVKIIAIPLFQPGKEEPFQAYATVEDITERKQDKEKIQDYMAELELRNLELKSLYDYLNAEIKKAMEIHERSLPKTLFQSEGFFLSAFYQPAEKVGGDFYNTIKTDNKLITYLSDVTGHGLESALLSTFIKDMINAYVLFTPEEDLTTASMLRFLYDQYINENYPEDYFICIYLTIVDLTTFDIEYLSPGFQDPAVLVSLEDKNPLMLENSGLPISSIFLPDQLNFNIKKFSLPPSSTILFNTDGITEQFVGEKSYGERLHEVFYKNAHDSPDMIVEAIKEDFKEFNQGSLQGEDDITLLVMQIR